MVIKNSSVGQLLRSIGVAALPGEVLRGVMVGDTVRVRATLDYRGPALYDTFYAAIGHRVVYFDEIWVGSVPISFPKSDNWLSYELTVDIPITEIGLFPWTPGLFDLYIKLVGHLEAGLPELSNVIEVVLKAEFAHFAIASYE